MKITEYSPTIAIDPEDVFLADGAQGTRTVKADVLPYALFNGVPRMHASIFRGAYLGGAFTAEQKLAISTGAFTDLWIGDYWVINGRTYRIADFNYWTSGQAEPKNHVVVIPDNVFNVLAMQASGTYTGYVNTTYRTTGIAGAKNTINTAFGSSYIYQYKDFGAQALDSSGNATSTVEFTCNIEAMNEFMLFGGARVATAYAGRTRSLTQFALFQMAPDYISTDSGMYWLRDADTDTRCAFVRGEHIVSSTYVSNATAVAARPCFAITGD